MSQWIGDVRLAIRSLIKIPSFTIASVLALCLAIGANTAVYSVIYALQSFPVPVPEPDRIAFLFQENAEQRVQQGGISIEDFLDYREQLSSFESLTLAAPRPFSFEGPGEPIRAQGVMVTPEFFDTVGVQPFIGRGLAASSSEANAAREVVISHAFWRQTFAGREDAIGETVRLDGQSHTVVGVAPEGFFFINPQTAMWTALDPNRGTAPRDQRAQVAFGRLGEQVDSTQATAEAVAVADRLASEYSGTNRGWTAKVLTLKENLRQGTRLVRVLFYSSITFVLLIACVNVANLLLARALTQERELAVRAALGATRTGLLRQQLTESLVLALFSGLLGVGLGAIGINVLRTWIAPDPNVGFIAQWIRLDAWVTFHAFAVAAISGLLFGSTPALQALSKIDLGSMLKEGGRSGDDRRRRLLRAGLVAGEVTLALALLITAATLIRAFQNIYDADPGFKTDHMLTLQLVLSEAEYEEVEDRERFWSQVRDRIQTLPGVESVATSTVLPLTQFPGPGNARAEVEGRADGTEDRAPNVSRIVVSEGYLETMGIELRQGRSFEAQDRAGGSPVAVVNETFVERFLGGEQAIDTSVRLLSATDEASGPWLRIVGVVADHASHAHSLRRPSNPALVFVPERQHAEATASVLVRTQVPPMELSMAARAAIWEVDPRLPIDPVQSLEQAIAQIDTQNTFFLRILSGLALVAFVLAAVGIYGIVSYSVSQRTREIGIRAALGARPATTALWISSQAAWLTAIGLLAGSGIAWMLVRFMASQLDGIGQSKAGGPGTFLFVAGVFLLVAVASSAWPALRAARIHPMEALRDD